MTDMGKIANLVSDGNYTGKNLPWCHAAVVSMWKKRIMFICALSGLMVNRLSVTIGYLK